MTTNTLNLSIEKDRWEAVAHKILQIAKAKGATQAETSINNAFSFCVTVRKNDIEKIEHHRNKSIAVTVFVGKQKGSASTVDTSSEAVESTVAAAYDIAKLSNEDPYAGLADVEDMATHCSNLDLYHPWLISIDEAIQIAKDCEATACAVNTRVLQTESCDVSTYQGIHLYANSHNFMASYPTSLHNVSCMLIAKDKKGMQRDGSYTIARDPSELQNITTLANEAAQRTIKRLSARRIQTMKVPVIFHAEIASSLLHHFLSAISGGLLYRNASFLLNQLNKPVFPTHIQIYERPHLLKRLGSSPFDHEGVATKNRNLVTDGVLNTYLLSSYSARKLGMKTTGHAGGTYNVIVKMTNGDLTALLKKMDTGLLITELMGQGVNLVTGDYSRGASGFWVEKGSIQYPVEEFTVAGNLRDMFKQIIDIGNDVDYRHAVLTGSILLETMTIAGN